MTDTTTAPAPGAPEAGDHPHGSLLRRAFRNRLNEVTLLGALLVLATVLALQTDKFLSPNNLINIWPTAIRLLASGAIDLDQMVTDHFPLTRTADALEAARRDPTFLKAVVRPHG